MPKGGLVKGDGGSKLRVLITDSETNAPIDLTNKTITLRYSIAGGVTMERTMTALDQATLKGYAEYQFLVADLNASGDLSGEARVNAGLSDQLTSDTVFTIPVRDPLP